ncbi:hypothetical protein BC833DRAFT_636194 [Globomyces pollinis-pini]|nr:hypothetical protein BC833DRAFT_636194 [Globomyces pollinis-pini]
MALNNKIQCPEKPLNSYLLYCRNLREQHPDARHSFVQLSRLWKEADPNLKEMFQNQAGELGKVYSKVMQTYRRIESIEGLIGNVDNLTFHSSYERYQYHLKLLKSYREFAALIFELNHKTNFWGVATSPASLPINAPIYLDISSSEKQLNLIRFEY